MKKIFKVEMYQKFNVFEKEIGHFTFLKKKKSKRTVYFNPNYILASDSREAFDIYEQRYIGNFEERIKENDKYLKNLRCFVAESDNLILDNENPEYEYGYVASDETERITINDAKELLCAKDFLEYFKQELNSVSTETKNDRNMEGE